MKGVKRLTPSSYEIGDFVAIVSDDHVFAGKDLTNGRGEESLGDLTDEEIGKLIMEDEQINQYSAISQIPTFRSLSTKQANMKMLRRRKYHFDNGVKLKANAQKKA